jgi:steroid delta-isomerase-like uncharacterized protein
MTVLNLLEREAVEDFAERYEEAWASGDPERIASMCTEDVVWTDPAIPEPLLGREGVIRFVTETFRMCPDFRVVTLDGPFISPSRPHVLLPYRMTGTVTGPWIFRNMAPTGRRFEVEGVDSWRMRDGLIAHYATFWDSLDASRQMGVFPAEGSAAERVIERMQHVQARFQRRSAR